MQKRRTFTVMAILLAVLVLGVGYAAIANVTLNLNGTGNIMANADFAVVYDTSHTIAKTSGTVTDGTNTQTIVTASYTSTTLATMTVWLDDTHREAYAIFKVDNNSTDLSARLTPSVTEVGQQHDAYFNDIQAEYYTASTCATGEELGTDVLEAGDSAYLKVTVSLEKSPLDDITGATFSVQTTAEPVEAD